jgi:hypothetical protein
MSGIGAVALGIKKANASLGRSRIRVRQLTAAAFYDAKRSTDFRQMIAGRDYDIVILPSAKQTADRFQFNRDVPLLRSPSLANWSHGGRHDH